jgi:hypothetical protein
MMPRLEPAIEGFTPDALRAWSEAPTITFVGTSGRVFLAFNSLLLRSG